MTLVKKTITFSLHSFFILEVTADLLWLKNTKIDQLKKNNFVCDNDGLTTRART